MEQAARFTALIQKEGEDYVALCPELDIASQGSSVEEAKANLREAVELFFEVAGPEEVRSRLKTDLYISPLEVVVG